ncbi:hypothetical protein BRADI_2g16663v3 [Brachypodium distachyon]|uniref:Uncharacterized protein n=1 Tax=Brachypodium distachyon TaxID=15368 RepID=A0A2K2D8W5_BRADI|nr:hypothetical protein BRADI_2g16663v3 [Brachypodium distachyon]
MDAFSLSPAATNSRNVAPTAVTRRHSHGKWPSLEEVEGKKSAPGTPHALQALSEGWRVMVFLALVDGDGALARMNGIVVVAVAIPVTCLCSAAHRRSCKTGGSFIAELPMEISTHLLFSECCKRQFCML